MLYPSLINFQIRIVLPLFKQAGLLLLVTFVTVLVFLILAATIQYIVSNGKTFVLRMKQVFVLLYASLKP
jgi:hypothetical protein